MERRYLISCTHYRWLQAPTTNFIHVVFAPLYRASVFFIDQHLTRQKQSRVFSPTMIPTLASVLELLQFQLTDWFINIRKKSVR
ncbi:MAG: hypothetical protein B0W54_14550 [Cellvibrio sp. 79]|nr:MAG: hypothetical protein B0W54_14550 [Cellvibrio sp. 79]